jgi:hypothetical protein
VAYESTDTEILHLLTATLRPSGSSVITSQPNTPTASTFASPTPISTETSPPTGLSQADKIAIGVVVPLAVIALVALLLFFFCRKSQTPPLNEVEDVQMQWEKPELPAHSPPAHSPPAHTESARAELEGTWPPPHELQ